MVSIQRRRGVPVTIYPWRTFVNSRGEDIEGIDRANPIAVERAFFSPQRGGKAEVPGQMDIEVYRMITAADLSAVTLRATVAWRGQEWDVVTPPERHVGTRMSRHWTMDIRRRSSAAG